MTSLSFHDYQPEALSFYDTVIEGLSQPVKQIPPKFFYDAKGSWLFEKICQQPEYYPPAVEQQILKDLAGRIDNLCGQGRTLIEPGAGSARKVRLLLDALRPGAFVPMDISFDFLKQAATQLAKEYPWLPVLATCVDFTHSLPVPDKAPEGTRLLFFPGSSLGNFDRSQAREFLRLIHATLGDSGMLLIGVDTRKDASILNAAYNDAAGYTAQFNLNLLHRLQNELDADLDISGFQHEAFYNDEQGRIEMHLVSRKRQQMHLNGNSFNFEAGESIHTENSYKYSPDEFIDMAEDCGFKLKEYWQDQNKMFTEYLFIAQ